MRARSVRRACDHMFLLDFSGNVTRQVFREPMPRVTIHCRLYECHMRAPEVSEFWAICGRKTLSYVPSDGVANASAVVGSRRDRPRPHLALREAWRCLVHVIAAPSVDPIRGRR